MFVVEEGLPISGIVLGSIVRTAKKTQRIEFGFLL